MGIWYATREDVKSALDVKETARNNSQVDSAIEGSSRAVESQLNRVFYPTLATMKFDWPNLQYSWPWVLWLHQHEAISLSSLTSGGIVIPSSDYFLEPVNDGPPYDRIEINLANNSAFSAGSTWQRSVVATGLFGYDDNDTPAGSLAAAITTTSATTCNVTDSSLVGVGSLIKIDTERLTVTGKSLLTTSQTASITSSKADVTLAVSNGTLFYVGEVVTVDAEKMLIVDIAGNNLIVTRAWDGSVLATHSTATVYAPRTLTIARGVLGTTAATHLISAPITSHVYPGTVKELAIAESLNTLLQKTSGYARTIGSGDSARQATGAGIEDIRRQAYAAYGRKARTRAI